MNGYAWLVKAFRRLSGRDFAHGPGCPRCDAAREQIAFLLGRLSK